MLVSLLYPENVGLVQEVRGPKITVSNIGNPCHVMWTEFMRSEAILPTMGEPEAILLSHPWISISLWLNIKQYLYEPKPDKTRTLVFVQMLTEQAYTKSQPKTWLLFFHLFTKHSNSLKEKSHYGFNLCIEIIKIVFRHLLAFCMSFWHRHDERTYTFLNTFHHD